MTNDPMRRLPTNAVNNLAAILVTLLPALLATPFIVHRLGEERFGIYLLALSVAGIAGLLDMGLSTASVKFVAECRARGDDRELSLLINSLILVRLPVALVAATTGFVAGPWLCSQLLGIGSNLLNEAVFVVRASMLTLAVGLVSSTFAALPRAVHRFDIASRLGMGLGLALTGATVVVLALGYGLRAIAVAELSLNVLYFAVSLTVARRLLPSWRFEVRLDPTWVRRLGRFGAFVVLNTLSGFVFLHANRILLGRTLGPGAVPYLAVPWSLGARVAQVVNALTEAITPVASELAAGRASGTLRTLYSRSMRIATIAAMTIVVPLVVSAPELLALWLGPVFSERSATVLRILAVSAGVQGLGAVPYFLLNGIGRPAAANLPPVAGAAVNLVLTLALLRSHRLEGVAIAILCGFAVQTTILVLSLERALNLRLKAVSPFLGPLLLAALAAAVSAPLGAGLTELGPRFLVRCSASFVVFHGLLLVTGSYGRSEIDLMKGVLFPSRRSKVRTPAGRDA